MWCCGFCAPSTAKGSGTGLGSVAASAGGEVINVIDCEIGRITQRYTHPGEDFYTAAWSAVPGSAEAAGEAQCLLAAGGLQGDIKIIDHRQMVCYQQLPG